MPTWDELKVALAFLEAAEPSPLRTYPDPRAHRHEPPFHVALAPWAASTAARLHERFGDRDLSLTVGALRFPSGELRDPLGNLRDPPPRPSEPVLDPAELEVEPAEPLAVASGHDLRAELHLTNQGSAPVAIESSGTLFAVVVDPATGDIVGGHAGARTLPRVRTEIAPGATAALRLVVGTASFRDDIGYAVPPGEWAVIVPLELVGAGKRQTPPMVLRVVD